MANFGLAVPETGSDAELLVLVRATIARVLAYGQDRMHGGRRVTEADLPELRAMETEITTRINATTGPNVNYASRVRPN